MSSYIKPFRLLSFLVCTLALLCAGCADKRPRDSRLMDIADFVDDSPKVALDSLAAIDYTALGTADRHYHDFLSIKARDKAFITHTSDSLILDVLDYYENSDLHPEALYYGGRVNFDIGDYPTALIYFQQALENLQESNEFQKLRGCIFAQISYLLNDLRMYDAAIPYITESITISKVLNDTASLFEDYISLGDSYIKIEAYDSASVVLSKAKELVQALSSPELSAIPGLFSAVIAFNMGYPDSALQLLRSVLPVISEQWESVALSDAAEIYMKLGINDTAYIYADKLAHLPENPNRRLGYFLMLSPQLSKYIPADSLYNYITTYSHLEENILSQFNQQAAITQNAYFNYASHVREKERAKGARHKANKWLAGAVIVILCLICLIVILKNHAAHSRIRLLTTVNALHNLQNEVASGKYVKADKDTYDLHSLRHRIKEIIEQINTTGNSSWDDSRTIVRSQAYQKAHQYLSQKNSISDSDPLWCEIEDVIAQVSPNFKNYLEVLSGNKLSIDEYRLAMLIKFGFNTTESIILIGKTKGTISYWRRQLGVIVFGEKPTLRQLDAIIRCL